MAGGPVMVSPLDSRLRIFAGACAIALGLGVVRFDFAALGRQMLESGWVDPASIGRLAGLNLAGYVLGCLHHTQIRSGAGLRRVLSLSLAMTVASLWLEALGLSGGWQGLWRLLAGWASGHLMAGVPAQALRGLSGRGGGGRGDRNAGTPLGLHGLGGAGGAGIAPGDSGYLAASTFGG